MFQAKAKKDDDRFYKLISLRNEIELDNNPSRRHPESKRLISAWKNFNNLSYDEQRRRRIEWSAYYEKVAESLIYHIFLKQRDLARENRWGEVKELADEVRRMRENGHHITLTKPPHIDPFDLDNNIWIRDYKRLDREIKSLSSSFEINAEAEQVFSE